MMNHALIFFAVFLEGCGGQEVKGPSLKVGKQSALTLLKLIKNQIEKRGKLEGQIKERRRQTVLANIIGWSCQRHALALILGNNQRRTNLL